MPINNFIVLALLVPFVYSKEYDIAFTMCVAPKSIRYLRFTIDYFVNAYQHYHDNIKVSFFITRGCSDCDFEGYHYAVNRLTFHGIQVYEVSSKTLNFTDPSFFKNTTDKYESWITDFRKEGANNRDGHRLGHFEKDNAINYYSLNLAKFASNIIKPDFLMFLEDDTSFDKNFFRNLNKLFDNHNDGGNTLTRTLLFKDLTTRIIPPNSINCTTGFFGILLGKKEAKRFFAMYKYNNFAVCGDAYGCYMSKFLNLSIPAYHWGKHLSHSSKLDILRNYKDMSYWD